MEGMMSGMMLAVTWGQALIAFVFSVVCFLLIVVVLLQKGRGGGLSGAFGGGGGHSAFGAKTGDVFTWVTIGLTAMFILVAVIGNWTFVPPSTAAVSTPVVTPGEPGTGAQPEQGGAATTQPG